MDDRLLQNVSRLKFCGLTRKVDLVLALSQGVDYIGFNFWPGSKRYIAPSVAHDLWSAALAQSRTALARTGRPTQFVGVYVNPNVDEVESSVKSCPELTVIQLHGQETIHFAQTLQKAYPNLMIWKAITIKKDDDLQQMALWQPHVQLMLLDTPSSDGTPAGGRGERFDWALLRTAAFLKARSQVRWGLAGGLKPSLIREAASLCPNLLDICSGIESSPGIKDHQLMLDVLHALHEGP